MKQDFHHQGLSALLFNHLWATMGCCNELHSAASREPTIKRKGERVTQESPQNQTPPTEEQNQRPGFPYFMILVAIGLLLVLMIFFPNSFDNKSTVGYSFFLQQIKDKNVEYVEIGMESAEGLFKKAPAIPPNPFKKLNEEEAEDEKKEEEEAKTTSTQFYQKQFKVTIPHSDESRAKLSSLLEEYEVNYDIQKSNTGTLTALWFLAMIGVPILIMIFIWRSVRQSRSDMMGGGFLSSFNRSPAKRYEPMQQPITLKDVAGLEGVKADLMEIVEFLKAPEKFQKLGGRVPKGVLLNGPPGTGKTLLARAVAGEAGVPFFSVNGSEFIQMFVGVGASRVRDLFKAAKESGPGIIFIDEIDAVGRQRGAGLGGGHDEREQTLNQILSEMDGFVQTDSVIVIAATNRPDVLDPALLRPGRFDRHITVGRPTFKGRAEIFKVHVRDVPLDSDVDMERLAGATVGLTGADIRNMVNEAALWAARNDKSKVSAADFEYARDKILMGPKREEIMDDSTLEKTAYHEAGHTISCLAAARNNACP